MTQAPFACESLSTSASGALQISGTACCMRAVSEQQYHVASGFTTFLGSAAFESAVPRNVCSSGVFTDSTPPSNIVYNVSVPELGTNDLVVGSITGLPNSEVKLVQMVDFVTRRYPSLSAVPCPMALAAAMLTIDGTDTR